MLFMSCIFHAFASVHCCHVVTCWERVDLLFVMFKCVFVTFPFGTLGQVWYLIVSISDLCRLLQYLMECIHIQHNDCLWCVDYYDGFRLESKINVKII